MQLKRSFKTSLQFRVSLVLLLIFVCASVLAGWLGLSWTRNWFNSAMASDAERLSQTIIAVTRESVQTRNTERLSETIENALDTSGIVAIAVLDYDGTPIISRESSRSAAATLPIDRESVALVYDKRLDDNHLLMARPILNSKNGSEIIGAIRIAFDTSTTTAMLNKSAGMIWTLAAVLLLAMFPITSLLLREIILKPIHSLASATARLAEGDYSVRIKKPNTHDDLAALAGAFNLMAEQIESQHNQLVKSNVQLEDKVRSRTAQLDRLNIRLQSQMDEHKKFIRAVSHDLNAPLRNIAGMADLTLMKWAKELPEEVAQRLKRIKANVETESELIGDLLDISRLGAAPLRPELTDISELLNELAANFEYDLDNRKMKIIIAEPMPVVMVDANHIRKLFQNLIDNAIKYMPADRTDGQINISCDIDEQDYIFTVSDNGAGIDESDQDKIFTVFRRGQSAGKEPGRGVGLASVAAIAARYDGSIQLQSKSGAGSKFIIRLNRHMLDKQPQQEQAQNTEEAEVEVGIA